MGKIVNYKSLCRQCNRIISDKIRQKLKKKKIFFTPFKGFVCLFVLSVMFWVYPQMFNSLPSPGLQRSHRNAAAGFSPCLPCSSSPTKVIISKLSEQSFLPEIVAGHIFLKFCGSGQLLSLRINWSPNN